MSTFRGLYERFRHLIHEGSKFLVIGAIGTVITFGVANALHPASAGTKPSRSPRSWRRSSRSLATGTGPSSTARVRAPLATRWSSSCSTAIGLLIYYGCIGLTDLAGLGNSKLWYNIALVVGTGLGTLFRFWSYRKWVWVAPDVPVLERAQERPEEIAQDLAADCGRWHR